jgi:hypothetical protein
MSVIASKDAADRLLSALGEQLAAANERYELVVIGGSGLPARSHDPSEGYAQVLRRGLAHIGVRDVDLSL